MIPYQFVIDTATKRVLRAGYCDFATDGTLVVGEEVVVVGDEKAPGKNEATRFGVRLGATAKESDERYYDKADGQVMTKAEKLEKA